MVYQLLVSDPTKVQLKRYPEQPSLVCNLCFDLWTKMAEIEKWIEVAKECKYLPENDLKVSCYMIYAKSIVTLSFSKYSFKV